VRLYCTYFDVSFAFSPRLVIDIGHGSSAFRFLFHVASQSSQASEVTLGRFLCSRCVLPAQKSLPELHLDRLYHTTTLALSTFFRWMALRQAKKFASKGLRQDRSMRSHGRIPYAGFDIGGVSRACGGAWRLVELCFSCCLSAGLEDRDGRALANKSNQKLLGCGRCY
jgi:hypothetical protein